MKIVSTHALLAIAFTAIAVITPAANAAPPQRPNVLIIVIDDVTANIHSVGQPSPVQTPNIKRLADRSTWFTHAYNDAPACCPSRSADPEYDAVKKRLAEFLPKAKAPDVPEISPANDGSRWQDEAFQ